MTTETDAAAIAAYEHCARLALRRASISPSIDGDHAAAITRAFEALAEQFNASAAALKARNAVQFALAGANDD
mgnify:CR=1 FL=1